MAEEVTQVPQVPQVAPASSADKQANIPSWNLPSNSQTIMAGEVPPRPETTTIGKSGVSEAGPSADEAGQPGGEVNLSDSSPRGEAGEAGFGNPLEEEKTLLSWKALARPYKKRGKEFYTTVAALVFLLTIILVFFKEFLLIAVVWAFGFFAYVLSAVEPAEVEHKITTRGIKTGNNKYRWGELARFWFEEKWGNKILMVETWRAFPGRLMLLLGSVTEDQIKKLLVKKIAHDKPEKTWVDKASKWLQDKIPLEGDSKQSTVNGKQ